MDVVFISSLSDDRLETYRCVGDPEVVRRRGAFLAEGRMVVDLLLTRSTFETRSILGTQATLDWLRRAVDPLPRELPFYLVEADALRALSGFRFHQGCLAEGVRPETSDLDPILERLASGHRIVVGMETVSNPDNVGAVFRSAAAFEAAGVLLSADSCSPLYRKAIRTSMGASLTLPFAHVADWHSALDTLQQSGVRLAALTPNAPAIDLEAFVEAERGARVALLLGAEKDGLTRRTLDRADACVRIAMGAGTDSLNLAVSGSLALYRLSR